jgi:hypothetical protein
MYWPIPTWLLFLFLCIAAFAPIWSRWPGWWMWYYGVLLLCWILMSVAAIRRVGREYRNAQHTTRPLRDANNAEAVETEADAVRPAFAGLRLIIVARDKAGLYERIHKGQSGDEAVRIITDRRENDRRRQLRVYLPDRRRGERRHRDIRPLLATRGWAQVTSSES